jgi:hypothetical protein
MDRPSAFRCGAAQLVCKRRKTTTTPYARQMVRWIDADLTQ